MKIRTRTAVITEIDLSEIDVKSWPKEAKDEVKAILVNPRMAKQFFEYLPEFRLAWLIQQIERRLELQSDLEQYTDREGGGTGI